MTQQSRWMKAVRCSDVPPREGRSVRLAGREIAIFNLGDRFLAIDNRCPHKGGPLAEGIVAGSTVVCPLHAWKVGLENGSVSGPAAEKSCVKTHAVRVADGIVLVSLAVQSPENAERPPCDEHSTPTWSFGAEAMEEHAP